MNLKQLNLWFKGRLGYKDVPTDHLTVTIGSFNVTIISDPESDRIRVHTPICDISDVNHKEILEANSHSTQDVHYAIHQDKIYSVFTHWFSDMTDRELDEGFQQVIQLAQNTMLRDYWSGNMVLSQAYNEALKSKLTKSKVKKMWNQCKSITDNHKKGKAFEDFTKKLLVLEHGFLIDKPNKRTINEEIDVLIKNKMTSAHWIMYGSPYIMVECKNKSKPIESKEIRDFITKIENHLGHCTLGLFFSASGFTKGCKTELVGLRRTPIKLALIDGKDIDNFFESTEEVKEFLEKFIPESIQ